MSLRRGIPVTRRNPQTLLSINRGSFPIGMDLWKECHREISCAMGFAVMGFLGIPGQGMYCVISHSIAVTPHERHVVSNFRQHSRLFKSLFILTTKKIFKLRITVPGRNPPLTGESQKGTIMRTAFPCHGVIISPDNGIHRAVNWCFSVIDPPLPLEKKEEKIILK